VQGELLYTRSEEVLIRDEEYRPSLSLCVVIHACLYRALLPSYPARNRLFSQTHFTDVAAGIHPATNNVLHAALLHWYQPVLQVFELCQSRRCYDSYC
jgi:hypothetical protein